MVIKLSELTTGNLRMNVWKCKEYPQNQVVLCGSIWSWFLAKEVSIENGKSMEIDQLSSSPCVTRIDPPASYHPCAVLPWKPKRGDLLGSSPFQPLVFGGAICMKHDLCMYGVQVFNNLHLRIYCNIFSRVSGNDFFRPQTMFFWWTSDQEGTSLGYLWFQQFVKSISFWG